MVERNSAPDPIRFGVFEVDLQAGELRKSGARIRLEGQPLQILGLLLERPGQLVLREEIRQKLWPADTFVDFEQSINAAVKRLREALDDSADTPRFVETLPRRGYRFIYPVTGSLLGRPAVESTPQPRRSRTTMLLGGLLLLAALLALTNPGVRERLASGKVRGNDSPGNDILPADPAGYQLYVKGRHFLNRRNREDVLRSLDYFGQVVQANPSSPWGYAGLADTYMILGDNSFLPTLETLPKAETAARRALDERIAEAHATLGVILYDYHWDRPGAEREFKRAIELNPKYAIAYQYYADFLSLWGRHDDALVQIHFALTLDPTSTRINENLGRNLYFARRYGQAIEVLLKAVELDPNRPRGLYDRLGWAYLAAGKQKEAIETLQKAVDLSKRDSMSLAGLAHAYGISGNTPAARPLLSELIERSEGAYVSPVFVALAHIGLGQTEQALVWLQKGLEMRDTKLNWINADPRFDPLRTDPRFQNLLRRLKF